MVSTLITDATPRHAQYMLYYRYALDLGRRPALDQELRYVTRTRLEGIRHSSSDVTSFSAICDACLASTFVVVLV
jgi:hypothetical protein